VLQVLPARTLLSQGHKVSRVYKVPLELLVLLVLLVLRVVTVVTVVMDQQGHKVPLAQLGHRVQLAHKGRQVLRELLVLRVLPIRQHRC